MIAIRWGLAILAVGLALLAGPGAEAAIYESSLHQMTAGDFFGDGRNEVAYIRGDGSIFLHDFSDGQSRRVPATTASKLVAVDLDGNGRHELAFVDGATGHVRAYDFAAGSFSTIAGDTTYRDLTAGNTDADPATELFLSRSDYLFRYYNGGAITNPGGSGDRMVTGDFNTGTPGEEFAVIGTGSRGLHYHDPDGPGNGWTSAGGSSIQELAAGHLYNDGNEEVLLRTDNTDLYVHDFPAAWAWNNPIEKGTSPGIGRLDGSLPAGQALGYVVRGGQVYQTDPANPLSFLLLRRNGSNVASAAAADNSGWTDTLVADLNGDGLDELIARKADLATLHRFDNGQPGFVQAKATYPTLIADPSFEDTAVGDVRNDVAPAAWYEIGWAGFHSVFDPANAQFAGTTGDDVQGVLPDGGQVALTEGTRSFGQHLGVQVRPNTQYTLSFWVGDRADSQNPDFKVEILAGGAPIASWRNPRIPDNGTFEKATVVHTTGTGVSGELEVRFTGMTNFGNQTFFDLVEMTADPYAKVIPIVNPSFESLDAGDVQTIAATGWVSTNSVGPGHGTFDPTNGQFAGTAGNNANSLGVLPDGGQVGFVEDLGANPGGFSLTQDLGVPAEPDRIYTLSLWVGDRADAFDPAYRVELLAGSTPIIDVENPLIPRNGRFELLTLTGLTDQDASGNLMIRLSSLDGPGNNWQTFFDDVQLTSRAIVPEPASFALLGLGFLLGVPVFLRRGFRRHRAIG